MHKNWFALFLLGLWLCGSALADPEHAKGFIPEDPSRYAAMPEVARYRAFIPAQADLSALFPKPGRQGKQGSCVAWATAYAARTYYEASQHGNAPNSPQQIFSPAFIYNQVKRGDCDGGGSISEALELLKDTGVVSLAQFPYDENNCSRLPAPQITSAATRYRIDDWEKVDVESLDDVKGQIFAGNPVIFGMSVSGSFDKLGKNQIYDDLSSPRNGDHAMVLVGYDEAKQAFKLINSWGNSWGDKGFGWVSYRAFKEFTPNAFVIQMAAAPKPPAPSIPTLDVVPPAPEPEVVSPPHSVVVPPNPPAPEVSPPKPKVVDVPPTPAPKVKAVTISELKDKLPALLATANCADLSGVVNNSDKVTISGFAGQREDLTRIQGELDKLGVSVALQTQVRPWPQCEAMLTLHDVLAKPSGLKLSVSGGKSTLSEGERLSVEVTTPYYPSYVYLTYIQANGDAVHLLHPQGRLPKALPPNTHLVLGNGENGKQSFTINPPFGDEMIVAIASASPLFDDELPPTQIERDYLTRFRQAFLIKPESGAAERVVSAAMTTLVTRAKP